MSEQTPEPEQQPAPARAARHRERAPKSPEARQRGLAARKLERAAEQIRRSKDVQKLEAAAAALAKLNGAEEAPSVKEQLEEQPPAPPQKTAELSAVPATADASKPGWPTEAALADAAPLVSELVGIAAVLLDGTRFALNASIKVLVGDKVIERTKAEVLAERLTPLAAKYGAAAQQTPETVALLGVALVFGQPLVELAVQKVLAKQQGGA